MRGVVVAVFGVALACGPTSGGTEDGPNPCQRYLDCLAATDQETFEEELGIYGANGSCFANSAAQTCYEVCNEKRADLGEDDEACVDPPPDTGDPGDPPVGDDGKVDCLDLPAGGPTVGGSEPGPLGFPVVACSPRASGVGEYTCCSDDPSAVGGALPAYTGKGIDGGTPIFADANNSLSTWGLCVRTDDIPVGSGLAANNCPLPCDPTWSQSDVDVACGGARVCCQTFAIQPADCILDPETQQWRPARGTDVIDGLSIWASDSHATHQDPGGAGCTQFTGDSSGDAFLDCVAQLRVASQRGYCMALQPGQACPGAGEPNACDQINSGLIPPPR